MCRVLWVTLVLALSLPGSASAQLASPNKAGVSMGHLHYVVRDVDANKRFWVALGGTPIDKGGDVWVKFPDVLITLTKGESTGGTEGSIVNHVAFRVQSLTTVEAVGLKVARLANFPGVASTMSPEGERIELFENAALNLTFTQDAGYQDAVAERHNRPLAIPVAFHHIHLYLPAGKVAEAKAWYTKMFGGIPGKRSNYDAVDLPGLAMVSIPDGSGRKAVIEQTGLVRIIDARGRLLPEPFLNIQSKLVHLEPFFDEQGLLGIAFHPNYRTNGKFYIAYSQPLRGDAPLDRKLWWAHTNVVAEMTVSKANPNKANPERREDHPLARLAAVQSQRPLDRLRPRRQALSVDRRRRLRQRLGHRPQRHDRQRPGHEVASTARCCASTSTRTTTSRPTIRSSDAPTTSR